MEHYSNSLFSGLRSSVICEFHPLYPKLHPRHGQKWRAVVPGPPMSSPYCGYSAFTVLAGVSAGSRERQGGSVRRIKIRQRFQKSTRNVRSPVAHTFVWLPRGRAARNRGGHELPPPECAL